MEKAILFIGVLVFAAHLFSVLFERTKVPDVLLLMLIGLILGPVGGLIGPEDFGRFGRVLTTLALIVILFEGSLSLDIRALLKFLLPTLSVTLLSFLLTALLVGAVVWLLTPLPRASALLTGVILGGTSSAVVIPMIRALRLSEGAGNVAFMESVITDVLCIVGSLALLQIALTGNADLASTASSVAASFGLGGLIGAVGAIMWSFFLHRVRSFPNTFFTTVAFVMILYGLSEGLGFSGAITALGFGLTISLVPHLRLGRWSEHILARMEGFNRTERLFFSELVFLLKTFFFIYLGLSIQLGRLGPVLIGLLLVPVIFAQRTAVAWAGLPRSTPRRDAALVAILGPKGLAAAVLASIPIQKGLPMGDWIQAIVYAVIFFSILASAVLVFMVEKTRLGGAYLRVFGRFSAPSEAKPADG